MGCGAGGEVGSDEGDGGAGFSTGASVAGMDSCAWANSGVSNTVAMTGQTRTARREEWVTLHCLASDGSPWQSSAMSKNTVVHHVSRRGFLGGSALLAAAAAQSACALPGARCLPRDACRPTPLNPEGPYYRADAPERDLLNVGDRPGTPLRLSGRITSAGCDSPVPGARLDIWHADGDGVYDLDTGDFGLRGRVRGDDDGNYRFSSVQPGAYFFGGQARARHIHVKVTAPDHRPLTTQLYFPDDELRAFDAQYGCGLDVEIISQGDILTARFSFVLQPA